MNLPPLGFWYQAKTSPPAVISLQAIAGLVVPLLEDLPKSVIAEGLLSQYFPDASTGATTLRTALED